LFLGFDLLPYPVEEKLMVRSSRRNSVDELAKIASDLIDQVKVLVSAVDDLRCEVEWWSRNAADERQNCAPASDNICERRVIETPSQTVGEVPEPCNPAPASRPDIVSDSSATEVTMNEDLGIVESRLMSGPAGEWPTDWDEDEPPELPTGCVIQVDEDLWVSVLDVRPAHLVAQGCWCEAGTAAPYLMAWQTDDRFFLRELTEGESIELQQACLASQQRSAKAAEPEPLALQLGLWHE